MNYQVLGTGIFASEYKGVVRIASEPFSMMVLALGALYFFIAVLRICSLLTFTGITAVAHLAETLPVGDILQRCVV